MITVFMCFDSGRPGTRKCDAISPTRMQLRVARQDPCLFRLCKATVSLLSAFTGYFKLSFIDLTSTRQQAAILTFLFLWLRRGGGPRGSPFHQQCQLLRSIRLHIHSLTIKHAWHVRMAIVTSSAVHYTTCLHAASRIRQLSYFQRIRSSRGTQVPLLNPLWHQFPLPQPLRTLLPRSVTCKP
jgi:hypothetical protein